MSYYGSDYYISNYYSSAYYRVTGVSLPEIFNSLSILDLKYEALIRVVTNSDSRTMEQMYWQNIFGLTGTTRDIMYEGIVIILGYKTLKDYFDAETSSIWPDSSTAERGYWLKILTDNYS